MRCFLAFPLTPPVREYAETVGTVLRGAGVRGKWVRTANLHLTVLFLGEQQDTDISRLAGALRAVCEGVAPLSLRVGSPNLFGPPPRVLFLECHDQGTDIARPGAAIPPDGRDDGGASCRAANAQSQRSTLNTQLPLFSCQENKEITDSSTYKSFALRVRDGVAGCGLVLQDSVLRQEPLPHLTLVRFRDPQEARPLAKHGCFVRGAWVWEDALALPPPPPAPWELARLGLYSSVLRPDGPEYECVDEFPFKGVGEG